MVTDEPLLAICVDQSKAYDSARLDLLETFLAGSGLPQEVWRPMIDVAKAPPSIGEITSPPSGESKVPATVDMAKVPATVGEVPATVGEVPNITSSETKFPPTVGETQVPGTLEDQGSHHH